MPVRNPEDWTLAQGKAGGNGTIIRALARVPMAEQRAARPVLVSITWAYDGEATGGMPPRPVYDRIEGFENVLFAALDEGDWATEAAAITGNGARQWRFYTANAEDFIDRFTKALAGETIYPIELEAVDDPEWQGLRDVQPKG
ncbi:DUF695 domain-containing protein [Sphingomonas aliaeris]|uniref:DUF695 domain-containing protein n=1 Tax=Sphingomonas aliaeris TaxID=2759526 RepID=A0A974NU90_9SPHN|nr:DUF695 domain-containing protein [Sphingomonas aliaeris]QQV76997.1 DUF695 domain-containing protein [Sphingomonas aliaeris]